ncbi:phytanoyl-CoA dioxygenase family protein [Planktotalea sp.]|uniref:phytanoyl-CoA dioxygenase family protein n=1 Tax=Planktotalea sp. TaxID=2029877 RepID=UPI003D6A0B17
MTQHPQLEKFTLQDLPSDAAAQVFQTQGCLQITDFLPLSTLQILKDEAAKTYQSQMKTDTFARVGHKRRMINLPIHDAFDDPALYAPRALTLCLDRILGTAHIINCFCCVVSQPGAESQHTHTDYQGLFASPLDYMTPAFALNLFVPLVPLNAINGTTQMWPGTHRKPLSNPEDQAGVCPDVPLGSALLMDYRVQHRGTANRSQDLRPIITLGFSRKWFIDTSNFSKIDPLNLDRQRYEQMDSAQQTLFERAKLYF